MRFRLAKRQLLRGVLVWICFCVSAIQIYRFFEWGIRDWTGTITPIILSIILLIAYMAGIDKFSNSRPALVKNRWPSYISIATVLFLDLLFMINELTVMLPTWISSLLAMSIMVLSWRVIMQFARNRDNHFFHPKPN